MLHVVVCVNFSLYLAVAWWEHRSWFQLSPAPFLAAPEQNNSNPSIDMGGNEGGGGDKWSFFGTRSVVQKSPTDPGSETSTGIYTH